MHDSLPHESSSADLEKRKPWFSNRSEVDDIVLILTVSFRIYQYTRKSVEGLSILLFVFAFMGNATYVGSIVLNPGGEGSGEGGGTEEERAYYLLEALP